MKSLLLLVLMLFSSLFVNAATPAILGESHTIHSKVLDEDRTYQVHLPPSYRWAEDRRYPVLYQLDGETHFLHASAAADYLGTQGQIPELIVVAITSTVRVRDFTQSDWSSHWIGGGGAANFKRFLSSELIPEIERSFRTDGFRILSGHSASGQFALYCLSDEPTLFKAYIALSSSLDWDDQLPRRMLDKSFDTAKRVPAFLYVAHSDDRGEALAQYDALVKTLKDKSPKGFRWHSAPFPNETHGGVALIGLIDALRAVYSGYYLHNDDLPKGLAFAEQHFQKISKLLDWPITVPESVINDFAYEALGGGKIDEALALFQRNARANPNSANALDGLTDAYAEAKRWQEAADSADRALALAIRFDLPNRAYFEGQAKKMHSHP